MWKITIKVLSLILVLGYRVESKAFEIHFNDQNQKSYKNHVISLQHNSNYEQPFQRVNPEHNEEPIRQPSQSEMNIQYYQPAMDYKQENTLPEQINRKRVVMALHAENLPDQYNRGKHVDAAIHAESLPEQYDGKTVDPVTLPPQPVKPTKESHNQQVDVKLVVFRGGLTNQDVQSARTDDKEFTRNVLVIQPRSKSNLRKREIEDENNIDKRRRRRNSEENIEEAKRDPEYSLESLPEASPENP